MISRSDPLNSTFNQCRLYTTDYPGDTNMNGKVNQGSLS